MAVTGSAMTGTGGPSRVAVVGTGIVGVCCALRLQHVGHEMALVDARTPGTAAAFS